MKEAIEKYVAALNERNVNAVIGLFTEDARIEDPVGQPPIDRRTRPESVHQFFARICRIVTSAEFDGAIRSSEGRCAAAPIRVHVQLPSGARSVVSAIDVMTFDDNCLITHMQAYHGFSDRQPAVEVAQPAQ